MPNIASALKEETSRIARKEVHGIIKGLAPILSALKKENSNYKKRIAQLETKVVKLEKQLGSKEGIKLPKPEDLEHSRLGASNIVKLRKKLGVTRAEMGKLIGASTNSIFLWENGKANPRAAAKAKIIALRSLGRRELKKLLADLDGKKDEATSAAKAPVAAKRRKPKAVKTKKLVKRAKKPAKASKKATAKPIEPSVAAPVSEAEESK